MDLEFLKRLITQVGLISSHQPFKSWEFGLWQRRESRFQKDPVYCCWF